MQWEWTLTSLCTSLDRALDVKLYLVNCHDVTSIYTNIYICTSCVTASFVIKQFILSTLSDNPCYYFTFWGPFIVAVSYVIPHLQPTYRNHQSWWGKYPYIHTHVYLHEWRIIYYSWLYEITGDMTHVPSCRINAFKNKHQNLKYAMPCLCRFTSMNHC